MDKITIPKYAKIIKGSWKKDHGYGEVWCKIEEIHIGNGYIEMSLHHPKYGGFAWVNSNDCEFSFNLINK